MSLYTLYGLKLLVFIFVIITRIVAAPKYVVEEDVPFVWCDEDFPILDVDDITAYLVDDSYDDTYY